MGARGPVGKRKQDRLGNVTKAELESVTHARGADVVEVPAPDPEWHEIARDWFASLAQSGQSRFYEPSDWQRARYVAEAMSRNLNAGRFSAQLFAAVISSAGELLDTEGARRRLRLELERGKVDDAGDVFSLDDYRSAL